MRLSLQGKTDRIDRIAWAWGSVCPTKLLGGRSLEDFSEETKASRVIRARLAEIDNERRQLIAQRNAADKRSLKAVRRTIFATLGDPDEGPNGKLYIAMGFIPKYLCRTGRGRRRVEKKESRPATAVAERRRKRRSHR